MRGASLSIQVFCSPSGTFGGTSPGRPSPAHGRESAHIGLVPMRAQRTPKGTGIVLRIREVVTLIVFSDRFRRHCNSLADWSMLPESMHALLPRKSSGDLKSRNSFKRARRLRIGCGNRPGIGKTISSAPIPVTISPSGADFTLPTRTAEIR